MVLGGYIAYNENNKGVMKIVKEQLIYSNGKKKGQISRQNNE